MTNAAALEDTRLSFFQVLKLVQALVGQPDSEDLWHELEQLNRLRNVLAHQLEPANLEDKVDRFLANFVIDTESVETMAPEMKAATLLQKVTFLCGRLKHILERSPGADGDGFISGCPL